LLVEEFKKREAEYIQEIKELKEKKE
jgi:uncharacterized coiled-coil DUF342 family protein